ncbi:MAG: hypothetical protein ACRDSJ_05530, partial [Rubrobacteraceae bacterium]
GTLRNLTNSPLLDWNPAWSHDGTRIVFQRRGSDNAFNIWTMNADGKNQMQRTRAGGNTEPAWSVPLPGALDGKIVYRHSAADLWTMNPDSTDQAHLRFSCPAENGGVCDRSIGIPTFSPDGVKVAFDYSGDIYWTYSSGVDPNTGTIPAAYPILRDEKNTEDPIDDTEYPGDERMAAWSPDGNKIAFQHNGNVPGGAYNIYTANADGSSTQATRITEDGGTNPDWQQDSIPPQTTITSGPTGATNLTSASFSFASSEAGSTFECSLDGGPFAGCASPESYPGLDNGSHTFQVKATDVAGNVDESPATRTFTVDIVAPTGGIKINNGAPKTKSLRVRLTLNATDSASGVARMCVSNTSTCSAWQAYATSKSWKLSGKKAGARTVYVRYEDGAGNVSALYRDTIRYAPKKRR